MERAVTKLLSNSGRIVLKKPSESFPGYRAALQSSKTPGVTLAKPTPTSRARIETLNPAGQVEREAHSRTSGSDQDVVMTGNGTRPVSDRPSMRKSRGGSQNSGNPLAHEPNALSLLGSDLHHGSSLQRSSLSSRPGLKRPFEPEVGGLEGPSLRRPPPVPTHLRESPPQRPSFVETIDPSDRNAAASHVVGGEMDLTNRPEHHANTQEASPTGGESPSSTDSESSGFPTVASLIRANLVTSTAPAIPRRDTPVPRVIMGPWDLHGPVVKPATAASFMRTIRGENKPDKEQNP